MKRTTILHWHTYNPIFAEARLCHDAEKPSSIERNVQNKAEDIATWVRENIGQPVRDIAVGSFRGLKAGFFGPSSTPEEKQQLQGAAEFLQKAPASIVKLISDHVENLEIKDKLTLLNLINHEEWIKAFESMDPTLPQQTVAAAQNATPAALLLSVDGNQREQMFLEYADMFIPQSVQDRHASTFGLREKDRRDKTLQNRGSIAKVLKEINGLVPNTEPQTNETIIARESLQALYMQVDKEGYLVHDIEGKAIPSNGLVRDYDQAMKRYPGMTTVQNLAPRNMRSTFGAAISNRFQVVTEEDLTSLRKPGGLLDRKKVEDNKIHTQTMEDLDKYGQVTRRNLEQQTKGFWDSWNEMSGGSKLVALGVLGYLSLKATRTVMAMAAVYVGVKMFGQRDMLDEGYRMANSGLNKIPGAKGINGDLMDRATLERNATLMEQFLSKEAREQLNESVAGFSLLSDTPIALLASNVKLLQNGTNGLLNINNPDLNKSLRFSLQKMGLSESAARRFFADSDKRESQVGDALASTFYVLASKDPANQEETVIVQEALASLPAGKRHVRELRNFKVGDPRRTVNDRDVLEIYERMVIAGQRKASSMGDKTLGEVVRESLFGNIKDNDPKNSADTLVAQNKLNVANTAFQNFYSGKPYSLTATVNGSNVTIGAPSGGFTITRPLQDFIQDPTKLDAEWKNEGFEELTKKFNEDAKNDRQGKFIRPKEKMTRKQLLGGENFEFRRKLDDANILQYGIDLNTMKNKTAETPLHEILTFPDITTDRTAFYQKYRKWADAKDKVTPPPPTDPNPLNF